MIDVILLSIAVVGAAMLAMAVGTLFSRNRCLRGSCGGLHSGDLETRGITCDTCPLRSEPTLMAGMDERPSQRPTGRPSRQSRPSGARQ